MLAAWRHKGFGRTERGTRFYVVVATGVAALIPLILFSTLWIRAELRRGQRDLESFLASRAALLSQRVDADLEPQIAALRVVASLPGMTPDDASAGPILTQVLSAQSRWSGLAVVEDGSGLILPTLSRGEVKPDVATVARVRESRRPIVVSQGEGKEHDIYLYAPIMRGDAVPAVVVAMLGTGELDALAARNRDRGILSTIIDTADRVLTKANSVGADAGDELSPTLASSFAGRDAGLFLAPGPEDRSTVYAFSRSPLTGWLSVVSMDRAVLNQMSTRSVWSTIAAGLLSLVLAVVLIVFIALSVLERRVNAERLAASLAVSDLDARLLATTQEALSEQRKASSEREILLREIYHRVKNNLQIVQSLLRLGSRELKPEQREPFESAVRRIGAMSRVHTLLYNSPDLASIDFKDYLEELLKELSEGFGGEERSIAHNLLAQPMRVSLDTAVPLAFIAVEILTNSFRHAFPTGRSGRISVEIAHDKPFGTLRIEDDGIGFSPDPRARRKLGLTIVRKLVQQIGGSIVEPEPGSSAFLIRFPLHSGDAGPHPLPAGTAGLPAAA